MHLTPRELDKLMIHTLADVALKRKAKGLKLNHPETVAVLSAAALEEARAGKTVEEVMAETRKGPHPQRRHGRCGRNDPHRAGGSRLHRREPPHHHSQPLSTKGGIFP